MLTMYSNIIYLSITSVMAVPSFLRFPLGLALLHMAPRNTNSTQKLNNKFGQLHIITPFGSHVSWDFVFVIPCEAEADLFFPSNSRHLPCVSKALRCTKPSRLTDILSWNASVHLLDCHSVDSVLGNWTDMNDVGWEEVLLWICLRVQNWPLVF